MAGGLTAWVAGTWSVTEHSGCAFYLKIALWQKLGCQDFTIGDASTKELRFYAVVFSSWPEEEIVWLPGMLIAAFNQVREAGCAKQQQNLEDYGKGECHLTAQLGTQGGRSLGGGENSSKQVSWKSRLLYLQGQLPLLVRTDSKNQC